MATAISSKQLTGTRIRFTALVDLLTQPFTRNDQPAHIARPQPAPLQVIETYAADNGITTLRLAGELTHRSTAVLIDATQAAYTAGATALIVDMAGVNTLSLAGLFALHNAARLVAGAPLLNPDDGWSALRAMKANGIAVNGPYLRLANVAPPVARFLVANGVTVED